jgi:glycosyltransferase involved in cell wall biosynthesis
VTLTALGWRAGQATNYKRLLLPWPMQRLRSWMMQASTSFMLQSRRVGTLFTRWPLLALPALPSGAHIVLELHSLPVAGSRSQQALKRLFPHPNLRRIVTISQALADDLLAEYGPPHPGCDIVVAHDGANAGPRPGPMPLHGGPITVGYFGHLYPGKGMEMIAALAPMLPNMRFEVYGGTETDLARWREACAGQENLTLYGHIPHAEVAGRMAGCDILIAPYAAQVSHAGGGDIGRWMSPLKLFEYMAAERPIVASDLPVLREVVRDGDTALLCTPGDVTAFAEGLQRLGNDPGLRTRLGAAGRDLLEAEYTWDRRARRVLEGITCHE